MSLKSSFLDFSVTEFFRLVDQGRKTGRLTISYCKKNTGQRLKQYFWFQEGQFIATSNTLEGTYLGSEIVRRGWLSQRVLEKLVKLSQEGRPLGLNLQLMGALQSEQVASLLGFQLKQLIPILETSEGEYQLDSQAPLPYAEMTGLKMRAMEVSVGALRQIQHWKALEEILPAASSALQRWNAGEQTMQLTQTELKVLDYADGRKSLTQISRLLGYEIEVTQHTAFRLMMANMVDEVPPLTVHAIAFDNAASAPLTQPKFSQEQISSIAFDFAPSNSNLVTDRSSSSPTVDSSPKAGPNSNLASSNPSNPKPSSSFLRGIVDFLRSKI